MALEIPSLRGDRLPGPDWGGAQVVERMALGASRLIGALEGLPLAPGVLDGLSAMAEAGADVDLFLAADRASVQLLLDGRRVALAGAARDAVWALLGAPQRPAPAEPAAGQGPSAGYSDPGANARAASIGVQVQQSRGQSATTETSSASEQAVQAPVALSLPLAAGRGAEALAAALARAVGTSGLFLEAHAAQWARGERPLELLLQEARGLASAPSATVPASADARAAAQLQALQRQALHLVAEAWEGQPVRLQIERDLERNPQAANLGDASGLFQATLSLDLPRLGPIQARVRVLDGTVGVRVEAGRTAAFAPALDALGGALAARGLRVAALELASAPEGAAVGT